MNIIGVIFMKKLECVAFFLSRIRSMKTATADAETREDETGS